MDKHAKEALIAEEAFMILHAGEIPEVTLHGSLYYLTEDPDGPGLELSGEDILPLKQAVVRRYQAIIIRDLDPENRDTGMYRGLARCAANWHRLFKFCASEDLDCAAIRVETAAALQKFMQQEVDDVGGKKRSSCINCPYPEIENLAESLGLSPEELPAGWQELCPDD